MRVSFSIIKLEHMPLYSTYIAMLRRLILCTATFLPRLVSLDYVNVFSFVSLCYSIKRIYVSNVVLGH